MTNTTTSDPTEEGSEGRQTLAPSLSVVHHPRPELLGLRLALARSTTLELGRGLGTLGPGVLEDSKISRRHASLRIDAEGTATLADLGSHNGTFVNGNRIGETTLEPQDVVGVGSIYLLYHLAPTSYRARRHERFAGVSYAVASVLDQVERVASHRTAVLILGETGTGKELVAREIHDKSGRRGGFFPINCAGVDDGVLQSELFGCVKGAFSGADRDRPGLVEAASGGTVLLDEIGDASDALQRSMLRVLQEGRSRRIGATKALPIDTRFVAATHRELPTMVAEERFREDFYARLAGWTIRLPPLREHKEDIPHIVRAVLSRAKMAERPIHHKLAARLVLYDYPRNVRELEKIVERALVECPDGPIRLTPGVVAMLTAGSPHAEPRAKAEKSPRRPLEPEELRDLLVRYDGNVTHLAKALGVGRNTLYRWIERAGIVIDDLR